MSLIQTINCDNLENFDISDIDKIALIDSKFKLAIVEEERKFEQPFDSDVGFTYDNTKAEFVGGAARQIDNKPANSTCWATYTSSIDLNYGSGTLTGTPVGGAAIVGETLDLAHNDNRYVDYIATGNAVIVQAGAIKFKYTPNYTGAPASAQVIALVAKDNGDTKNLIFIAHASSGQLAFSIYNNSGVAIFYADLGVWSPTLGQQYIILVSIDVTTGNSYIKINDVQFGATQLATGTRDTNIGLLRIGTNVTAANTSNFKIADLIFYSAVQTDGSSYILEEYRYLNSSVILPEMEYSGPGFIKAFVDFVMAYVGSPRILLEIERSGSRLYWDGAAWSVSNDTYAQATSFADFVANCTTLPTTGKIYGQFTLIFPDGVVQASVSDLTATMNVDSYTTDGVSFKIKSNTRMDAIDALAETLVLIPVNTAFLHLFYVNNVATYWDGATWSESNGSQAQRNTLTEVVTNLAALDLSAGYYIQWEGFIISDDGISTPEIGIVTLDYEYSAIPPDECLIYGAVVNHAGDPIVGADVRFYYPGGFMHTNNLVLIDKTITTDSKGEFQIGIIETETINKMIFLEISYTGETIVRNKVVIPNEIQASLESITANSDTEADYYLQSGHTEWILGYFTPESG